MQIRDARAITRDLQSISSFLQDALLVLVKVAAQISYLNGRFTSAKILFSCNYATRTGNEEPHNNQVSAGQARTSVQEA